MIVPFLAFALALAQVLIDQELISSRAKFIFAIGVAILSGIPLMIQFVLLSGELARARKNSLKLLMHRMMMTILGDYGPASNLLVMQYRQRNFGDYQEAKGFWRCVLYVGHGLAKFFGLFPFGDAFSGIFSVRHVSVALWTDECCKFWVNCQRPTIKDDDEVFSKPLVKDVRDLSLTVEFSPTTDGQSMMVQCDVLATGSRDSLVSKLYYEPLWKSEEMCLRDNVLELCTLMETLNNDSFVVKSCPLMENGKILNDQILACEKLKDFVSRLLREGKKLNAGRGYGLSYV